MSWKQGLKKRTGLENHYPLVLMKTVKTDQFLVQNLIFEFFVITVRFLSIFESMVGSLARWLLL
jgi:hypothetical protein